ncbi:MAG TPA: hypothetical protein VFF09_03795 [archaeon]|nr:hypothetical protein [archaeon]
MKNEGNALILGQQIFIVHASISVRAFMPPINAEWHYRNKMPKNANIDQRIDWHARHQKACGCMPIPDKMKEEMGKRGR